VGSDSLAHGFARQDGKTATGGPRGVRFETLFLRHYGRVFGILRRLLGSDEAAEDAAQEVFLRLYRQEAPPTDDTGLSRWLARVATNVGLNLLRADRRQRERLQRNASLELVEERTREEYQDPAREAISQEETALVGAVLEGMGERARTLLILRNSGLAYAEIADVLGVAPGSVGTLLARAEREFRRRYEARTAATDGGAAQGGGDDGLRG
jgi:RNA polymerase sigma-70 factor (ECF subfamily)